MEEKISIKNLTYNELKDSIVQENLPAYRAKQLFHWIYRKNVNSFQEMRNLPDSLINWLDSRFSLKEMNCIKNQKSQDGSEKFLFQLDDNHLIESVLIRGGKRNTICLSSQVGCIWRCLFCASGKDGLKRDLQPAEIIDQVLNIEKISKESISNVVFMGMGEPFNNYDNVMKSIYIINSAQGINIGARKITISTCGIIPGILKLIEHPLQVELSVSLHSADEEIRSNLMPVNKKYPLKELIKACRYYVKRKNRQITFEYLMLKGINDSVEQAYELVRLISDFDAKVNLIVYNPIQIQKGLVPSDEKVISAFFSVLKKQHIPATIRYSRGKDIQAACGQLRSEYTDSFD